MVIDVQLLGGFRVSVDKQFVGGLSGQRSQSLLACLVLKAGSAPLARAYLAGLLWPESTDHQARTNLRREIHKLRQSHAAIDRAIRADKNNLAWVAPSECIVDVQSLLEQSDRIKAADSGAKRLLIATDLMLLYAGHLLPGVTDEWVIEQRDAILRTYLGMCEELGRLLTDDGELGKAASLLKVTVGHDPLNESAWLALMELYLATDDRARSVRTYHQCASALRRELDVAPSEPLRLLYRRLTEDDDAANRAELQQSAGQPEARVSTKLFGRHRQQLALERCWGEVKHNGIRLVVIQGHAGIGKTRLAEAFLQQLREAEVVIARSRAYAAEGSLPFAPIKDWLKTESLFKATQMLAGSERQSLRLVFPESVVGATALDKENGRRSKGVESDPSLQRLAIFEAMANAITISGEPLVLYLDDIQWCDNDTLQWLRFLHRHAPACPVMILSTARSEALTKQHPVSLLISELRADGQTACVDVNSLDEPDSRDLIEHEQKISGSKRSLSVDETNRILTRAEGNPLFIVELVRASLIERDPNGFGSIGSSLPLTEKLYSVIQYRVSGLSANAQHVARVASAIGRQFTDQLLISASGLDESSVIDAVDELWQRKLIRVDLSGDYVFSHDYIREAVYAQLSPTRRKKLHLQVVDGLRRIHVDDIELVTGELAAHYERAGMTHEAVQWYQESARQLSARLALAEAMDSLEKGLALLESVRGGHQNIDHQAKILISLARCAQALNGFASPEMQEIYQRTNKLLPHVESTELHIDALEAFRRYYGNVNVPEAIRLSEQQITLSRKLGDDVRSVSSHRSQCFSLFQIGDFVAADATMAQANLIILHTTQTAMGTAERPHYELPLATGLWACVVAMRGHASRSQEIDKNARAYPIEHLPIAGQTFIRHFRMQHGMLHHNPAQAVEGAAWAADVARKYDYSMARILTHFYSGWALGMQGDHERAVDGLIRTLAECRAKHNVMYLPQRWAILAENQLALNQLDDAEQSLNDAFALAQSSCQPFWDSELHRLKARLLQARGDDPVRIQGTLNTAINISKRQGAGLLWLRAMLDHSRLLIELEQISKARTVLTELIDQQTAYGSCFELEQAIALLTRLSTEPAPLN